MGGGKRWSIVLAGGEGERLRPWVEGLFGQPRPKQYCTFLGRRSMLEHTFDRAAAASDPSRVITIIGAGHSAYLNGTRARMPGRVIEQPANRDTVAGIFFPLTYALAADPDASVAIFPSDHYIAPDHRFLGHIERAFNLAEKLDNRIVLLGAVPDQAEADFGWIEPERELIRSMPGVKTVRRFREKPSPTEAAMFYRDGHLWNTFIMVAKAKTIWTLAGELVPSVKTRFAALLQAVGTRYERAVIDWVYGAMKTANFSTDILQASADRTLVLTLEGVDWSDWGRPERVQETLRKAGKPALQPVPLRPATTGLNYVGA